MQLKPLINEVVKHYVTDFTSHDKKALRNYKGNFLIGYREHGTYISKFTKTKEDEIYWQGLFEKYPKQNPQNIFEESFMWQSIVGSCIGNTHFAWGINGDVFMVQKIVAEDALSNYFRTFILPLYNRSK